MSDRNNPFVGLRPFESKDSLFYFGRNEQTGAFLKYLHRTRFLAVVGSSGSGKSSLVRAGLIPTLEAGFLVRDCNLWHVVAMKPGDRPLYNLADALLNEVEERPSKNQVSHFTIAIGEIGIHAILERLASLLIEEESNLFLLVDQFEEVFRFGVYTQDSAKREEASVFVDLLLRLSQQDDIPVYVCLTMRSDYIGDCDTFHGLPEAINRSQYLVPRLTRSQRREAIEGPVRLSGASIAPRLLDRLLNESGENRDDLPVLQHALMRTWNEWAKERNGPIDTRHYEAIQTMKRALSQHADEALNELSDLEKHLARRLFQTLTETDAENRRIRRSVHLNDIADVINAPRETIMRIIGKFCEDSRSFLVLSSEATADNPLVDISHESLMRQWDTLGDWMDEEAESAKTYKRLAEEAELYKQGKAALYTDPALQIALDWEKKEIPSEAWAKRYHKDFEEAMAFLDKSRKARDKKIKEEENKRKERERLLSEKADLMEKRAGLMREKADLMEKQSRQQQKLLRQTRIFTVIFTVVISIFLVIATILAYQAKMRSKEAEQQTLVANFNLAKAFEEKAMNALKSGKCKEVWLYTVAALKQKINKDKRPLELSSASVLLTPGVLNAAFSEKWFSPSADFYSDDINYVAFSPDGKTLASGSDDPIIRLWQVDTGKEIRTLKGHSDDVNSIAFSPDGKIMVSGSDDCTIRLWQVDTGEEIRTLRGHSGGVNSIAFSPDGGILASSSDDDTIRLWEVATRGEIRTLRGHSGGVSSITFSPDGEILASGSDDDTIRLWQVDTGEEIRILRGHSGDVSSIAFSPDGEILASGSWDNTIRLWQVSTGTGIRKLEGHPDVVTSVVFSPDGKILASGSWDNTIRLWQVGDWKEIQTLTGHSNYVNSIAFSPDGKILASGSVDDTVRLWQVDAWKKIHTLMGHSDNVNSIAFSPYGKTLASGSDDSVIRLWQVEYGKEIRTLTRYYGYVKSIAFSPDGRTLASGFDDGVIRLWQVGTWKKIRILKGHRFVVTSVAFSPDGKTLASGSWDNTIRLWQVKSGKVIRILKGHSSVVTSVAFTPDGKALASGSEDDTIRLWRLNTGKHIRTLKGHSDDVNSIDFSPNGKTLASGSDDNTIWLWQVNTGKHIQTLKGHSSFVTSVAFSPDGEILASGSKDNTIRLWRLNTGKHIRTLKGHSDYVNSIAFSPDGEILASGSKDNTIRLWDLHVFNLFIKSGKPTPLFYTFSEGAEFFWGVRLEGLEYKKRRITTRKSQDGYYFVYDKKFRPLLDPPAPGQTKFDQILEWAKKQQ